MLLLKQICICILYDDTQPTCTPSPPSQVLLFYLSRIRENTVDLTKSSNRIAGLCKMDEQMQRENILTIFSEFQTQ